jgi:hypothetical protein
VGDDGGGIASTLVDYARQARYPIDLQFRRDAKGKRSTATLYVGLTAVLNLHASSKGFWLDVHKTHQKNGGFDSSWTTRRTKAELAEIWPDVELYLDRIIPIAAQSHGRKEGAVQAAFTSYDSKELVVIDREVTPSFVDKAHKEACMRECERPILDALAKAKLDFRGMPARLGNECDALAVDASGRLLAVEVKPLGVGSIAWVAAQAAMYARIMQAWVDSVGPEKAATVVQGMFDQRAEAGLASRSIKLVTPIQVVPVVALQRGASAELIRRMVVVRDVLGGASAELGLPPVEVREVNVAGKLLTLDESRLPDGRPRSRVAYATAENRRQVAWKLRSLPADAHAPGQVMSRRGEPVDVEHVLPTTAAELNLLDDVRGPAIDLFEEFNIPWHQGSRRTPSANLRSSQVQCVNALGRMMADPERIKRAFGARLDIETVRDFGEIDPVEKGRFLTFEYIGPADHDYFGEGNGGRRTRGSQCTSVDAAFAYVTSTGSKELALVEWKYTETYPSVAGGHAVRLEERKRRYQPALSRTDSPVDIADLPLGDLFHEPIYQLVRQQLLARELERDPSVDADVVRVVHVLSRDNSGYSRSYVAPSLRPRGATVSAVWESLLRTPDKFVPVDPEIFLDPAVTSPAYVDRYGDHGSADVAGAPL